MKPKWKFIFSDDVKWSLKVHEVEFKNKDRTYVFVNESIIVTFINLIESKKLSADIFSTPNPIVLKFLKLGLLKLQLFNANKKILEMNYLPSIKKLGKKKYNPVNISKFELELLSKSAVVRSKTLEKEIKFFNKKDFLNALENKSQQLSQLQQVIRQIFSAPDFTLDKLKSNSWDYHDLLFHENTCVPNPNYLASKKPKHIRKNLKALKMEMQSDALIERRSFRRFSKKPISFSKLSRLLWNIGRKEKAKHSFYGKHYRGIYPSAGAAYENEFYLLAGNCENLKKGLYRYDGLKHQLVDLQISENNFKALLAEAGSKVLNQENFNSNAIIVTSKIELLKKKYSKVVYRLALLNAGVIIGYLDFFSSKLKLGGCPTGSIDWKSFAEIVDQDGYKEFAVVQYVFGERENYDDPTKY